MICGCREGTAYGDGLGSHIEHCPLHEAAPELLAACRAIQKYCPCDNDITPEFNAAWHAMLAAIANAEGRW